TMLRSVENGCWELAKPGYGALGNESWQLKELEDEEKIKSEKL
ncbi:hypothetical protein Tco_0649265, partial [Tanacetum coccineum]